MTHFNYFYVLVKVVSAVSWTFMHQLQSVLDDALLILDL